MPLFDPFENDPLLRASHAHRARQEWRNPATDVQMETVGERVKNLGLTGLSYVGSVLDKPGRAVRGGLLGGKPRELMAALPFSDTLGLTDPSDAVSGVDLNKKYFGVKDDNSWKSWGLGLGTELLTDPLNLVGGIGPKTALTAEGKAAAKAGLTRGMTRTQLAKGFDYAEDALKATHTPEQIAHLRRAGSTVAPAGSGIKASEPLAGLLEVGLPFTSARTTLGTGGAARAVAPFLDKAVRGASHLPGAKTLNAWFNPAVKDSTSEIGQWAQSHVGTPLREELGSLGAQRTNELKQMIADAQKRVVAARHPELSRLIGQYAEGIKPGGALKATPKVAAEAEPIGQWIRAQAPGRLQAAAEVGARISPLRDPFAEHFTRMGLQPQARKSVVAGAEKAKQFSSRTGSDTMRKKGLRDIPGATAMVNMLANDPRLTGAGRLFAPVDITKHIYDTLSKQAAHQGARLPDKTVQGFKNGVPFTKVLTHEDQLLAKARQLTRYLGKREVGNVFDPSIGARFEMGEMRHAKKISNAKAGTQVAGAYAQPMAPGIVPMSRVMSQLGLRQEKGVLRGANVEAHKALAAKGLPVTEEYLDALRQPIQGAATPALQAREMRRAQHALRREIDKFGLTPERVQDLIKDQTLWRTPEVMKASQNAWNSFTNAFRTLTYSVWPTSHVRNAISSPLQSFTQTGPHGGQLAANRILAQKPTLADFQGIPQLAGITDPEIARRTLMNQYADPFAKISRNVHSEAERAGNVAGKWMGLEPPPPGTTPQINPWTEFPKAYAKTLRGLFTSGLRNPFGPGGALEMNRVGKGAKDFPLAATGHAAGAQLENQVRLGQFMDLLRKGYDPAEAGRQVLRTHFDYGGLTGFERNFMRPMFPFYTFMSRNLPLQLGTATRTPGVIGSQLRLAKTDQDEFIPQHLASGVAIPTGDEQGGNRQFVSQVGIPIEEAFERFKYDPQSPLLGTAKNTALAYAGGLNPLIKGPLEQLFNTQFFSGRKLSDLRPQGAVGALGKFVDPESRHNDLLNLVAQGAANTPATRFLTAADKLIDPRKNLPSKLLNLLTGVRISDVDMDKARAIEMRRQLEAAMQGNPAVSDYTNYYVKPENAHLLRPEDIERLRVLTRLQAQAQEIANQKRLQAARQI